MSISILDQFGEPVYFYRMDGQGKQEDRDRIPQGQDHAQYAPAGQAAAGSMARGLRVPAMVVQLFPQEGGFPIVVNGNQFIGAIGVGVSPGRPGWNDEICARRGLKSSHGQNSPISCRSIIRRQLQQAADWLEG